MSAQTAPTPPTDLALLKALQRENAELKKQLAEKEHLCDEEGAKDVWDLVERSELDELEGAFSSLAKQVDELEEREKGIMEYDHLGVGGLNSYERFCQAMSELEYDEKWIQDLQKELAEAKGQITHLEDERYVIGQIATANGWDVYPTDSEAEETDEE